MSEQDDEDEKMGLTRCGNFLKYSMFLFNAVIMIAGCGLLGFGVYTRTSDHKLHQLTSILGSYYYSAFSLALIISGGVAIVLAFFGCCGAIKEVKCMLGTFFIMLLLMLIGMVGGGIAAYVMREDIELTIKHELSFSLNTSYGIKKEVTNAWDFMQGLFNCCGVVGDVNSTTSWAYYKYYTTWFNNQTDKAYVPLSCCKNVIGLNATKCVGGKGFDDIIPSLDPPVGSMFENDLLFTEGCYTAVMAWLWSNIRMLSGVVAGVGALMILGMIFAVCLCQRITDDYLYE